MQSITCRDPELEESFSFRSSAFVAFSDNDEIDEESYIEIALGPTPNHHLFHHHDRQNYDLDDDEMELRISFSSNTVPKTKGFELDQFVMTPALSSSSTSMSNSSTESESMPWKDNSTACNSNSNSNFGLQQLPSIQRFINSIMSSLRVSSENDRADDRPADTRHLEIEQRSTRKASSNITSVNGGIIMKIFIKFQSLKVSTLLALIKKPIFRVNSSLGKGKRLQDTNETSKYQRFIRPFDKRLVQRGQEKSNDNNTYKRVTNFNMVAIKRVFEALSVGRKDKKMRNNSPSSSKSSPIHQMNLYVSDNSIQAAITHCKSSFNAKCLE